MRKTVSICLLLDIAVVLKKIRDLSGDDRCGSKQTVWELKQGLVALIFYNNARLGKKVEVPTSPTTTQISVATKYHNSFACRAARLWNTLPCNVNTAEDLASFKVLLGKWLERFPDRPPVTGRGRPYEELTPVQYLHKEDYKITRMTRGWPLGMPGQTQYFYFLPYLILAQIFIFRITLTNQSLLNRDQPVLQILHIWTRDSLSTQEVSYPQPWRHSHLVRSPHICVGITPGVYVTKPQPFINNDLAVLIFN
eukprot:sb/3468676/